MYKLYKIIVYKKKRVQKILLLQYFGKFLPKD